MGAMLPGLPGLPAAPLGFANGFSGSAPPMIGTQSLGLGARARATFCTPGPALLLHQRPVPFQAAVVSSAI